MKNLIFRIFVFILIFPEGIAFGQLTVENLESLPEMEGMKVHDIIQDKFGYIWMATQNGLIKYDGYEYQRFYYDPNDTTSIQTIVTLSLYEDRKGNIWIGCLEYVYKYDQGKKSFKKYKFGHLLERPKYEPFGISEIIEDSNGRIVFGVSSQYAENIENGLLYYDEAVDEIKSFSLKGNHKIQNINNIVVGNNKDFWVSAYNGFFNVSKEEVVSKIDLPADFISLNSYLLIFNIGIDKDGVILITSAESKFFAYDPKTNLFSKYSLSSEITIDEPLVHVYDLVVDKENIIWLGTNKGLISFDRKLGKIEKFSESDLEQSKIKYKFITNMILDSFGILWLSSTEFGVLKYENKSVFESIKHIPEKKSTSLFPGWVAGIRNKNDGQVWIFGGSSIDVWDFTKKSIIKYNINELLPFVWGIFDLYEEKENELLISTNLGVFNFYPNQRIVKKSEFPGVPDSVIVNIFFLDSRSNFWLGTNSGLYKRENKKLFFEYYDMATFPGSSIVTNDVRNFFESPIHGLWIQTNDGLFLFDYSNDTITRHVYDKNEGDVLISQDINSFFEDSDGIVWIGTWQGGLSRYIVEKKKVKTYTVSDGLPSMSIQAILSDEKNKTLWLSTFNGLSRFDLESEQFSNFTVADGIHGNLFSDGDFLKTSGGLFAFGGEGVTLFDPENFATNSTPPKVLITDFKIDNKSISKIEVKSFTASILETDNIILDYNQNNISIDYLAIHFSRPSKNKYSYKLENFDEEWREVGNQRTAFYTNLAPGKYVFRVKAANPYGMWNNEGDSISIEILKPWWKSYWAYSIYFFFFIAFVFLIDRFQRKKLMEKERERIREKEIVHGREIEKAYTELKSTQAQLIQSEKMASLGELTAGIAHEIQNPLNFVNNFSEVSAELVEEIKETRIKSQETRPKTAEDEIEDEILEDIKQNLEKINHHGKRADAIVKGMLEHSRVNKGEKAPTDLNALADEFVRLSYHGLRAKDKSFNADFKLELDPDLPKVNVVASDIGRVILNLVNNAFYAVNEKAKSTPQPSRNIGTGSQEGEGYQPEVIIKSAVTKSPSGDLGVEISVQDNGSGIPDHIKEKIFQPFFTTKPTGSGTGLGLSLSYDIVKAHGGELRVESIIGSGTIFRIILTTGK
jgi:signal transduction histidine kinase/ligand-binding sensor domain-containing protein